jgi:hypothetical protein
MKKILANLEDYINELRNVGVESVYKKTDIDATPVQGKKDDVVMQGVRYSGSIQLTARKPKTQDDDEATYFIYMKATGQYTIFSQSEEKESIKLLEQNIQEADKYITKEIQKMFASCKIRDGVILP